MDINSGLQLHLPLNEIVENSAKEKEVVDTSGNKFNGKVYGATIVPNLKFGNCINFDGVDDYIELPTETIPQTGEITISFWANGGKSLPKTNAIFWAPDKNNHYMVNVHLPWSNSNIYFDCGNTSTSDNSFDRINKLGEAVDFKDKWTYWTFTKNVATGEMNIYLNGTLWHSGTGKNQPITSVTQVKLGASTVFYDGKVAHLRIYDRVLSPEEINECMKVDGTPPPADINRGLQLHLPLNETVENLAEEKEVVDTSGNKLNGKVYGATIVPDLKFGSCMNFDGVDDFIELPTETIPQTGAITISFWAYGDNSLPKNVVLMSAFDQSNQRVVCITLPWGDKIIHFDCGNTLASDDTFDRISKLGEAVDFKDKWSYWTFTKNVTTGEMNIYLGGDLWLSGTGKDKPIGSVAVARLGCYYNKHYYDGKVAHLRIYDRALSPEEINECMKVDATPPPVDINRGLQLHLPLNEIVEDSVQQKEVIDISDNKLNGTVYGATVVTDSQVGNCLSFDGVDNYIQLPAINFDYSQGFTVGAWVYYESFKKWSRIIDFGIAEKNENILLANEMTTNKLSFNFFSGSTDKRIQADGILELSQWVYLTATIDGLGNAKLYKNGQEVERGLVNLPNSVNRTENYIGKSNWSTDELFHGKILNLRVYNRVLSEAEINECMKVDATSTTDTTDTKSTTEQGVTETSSTDGTDTTQKSMEYQIYQVKGNPTIPTGYSASEWTAVIAGFNCGTQQKHKATALMIMPVVDDGEWKIKCDIKDASDRYWDVAVLFIRNNMVNRLNNFSG